MDTLHKTENAVNRFIHPVEKVAHKYLLAPTRFLLEQIDPWAERINGTLFKKVLQVSIYPIFMVATFIIGFKLIENGYTFKT